MALTKISTGMLKQDAASSDLNIDAGTLYLDVSNNRVGVNKTSPSQTLHVNGMSQFDNTMLFGSRGRISWGSMGGGTGFGIRAASGNALSFGSNGAWDKAIIDTAGRLLINATTTAFSDKLYVNEDAYTTGGWRIGTSSTFVGELKNSSGKLTLQTAANRDIQIGDTNTPDIVYVDTSAQKVGIGTSSPGSKLTVEGDIRQTTGDLLYAGGGNWNIRHLANGQNITFDTTTGSTTSEKMRIRGDGNVGIGDTNPSALRLSVVTPTANHIGLQVVNSNTADSFGMVVKGGNDANDYTADFRKRDNTNIMRIRGDGNVGIGTSSPNAKLEIKGASSTNYLQFNNSSDTELFRIDSNFRWAWGTASPAHAFDMRDNSGNALFSIDRANGNVGIGTNSPADPLHVQFSNNTGADTGIIVKNTNTGTTTNFAGVSTQAVNGSVTGIFSSADYDAWGVGTFAGSQSNHPTYLIANNAVKMTIGADGNVGIGTTTPNSYSSQTTLTINGQSYGRLDIESAGSLRASLFATAGSASLVTSTDVLSFDTSGGEAMRIDSSGTLFQGTTLPTLHSSVTGIVFANGSLINGITRGVGKALTLAQNLAVDAGNTWAYLATDEGSYYQQYGGNHYFGTAPSGSAGSDATVTSKLTILNSGNVGIGTTNPAQKLHIKDTSTTGGILLTRESSNAGAYLGVKYQHSPSDSSYYAEMLFRQVDTNHGGQIEFWTDNSVGTATQRMTINKSGNVKIVDTLSVGTTSTLKGYFYESTADQNGNGKPSSVLGLAANINSRGEGPSIDFNAVWGAAEAYQQDNWNEGWTVGRIAGVYHSAGLDTGALAFYTQTSGSSGGANSSSLTEKMRIDAVGNVGIGVVPSASHYTSLEIGNSGSSITGRGAADTHFMSGLFWDAGSTYKYSTSSVAVGSYQITNGIHYWATAAAGTAGNAATPQTNMILDASGNLLVGNTVANPASGFTGQRGFGYEALTGKTEIATTADAPAMQIGKNHANDGNIVVFRKQSVAIGSIGTLADRIYFAGTNEAVGIDDSWNAFVPLDTNGGNSNDDTDLGNPSSRFKDLWLSGDAYLSGGVYLGGTAAANKLDDYEEGTWTPKIAHNDGTGEIPVSVASAKYTKIGNVVYVNGYLTNINPNGNAGTSSPYYGIRNFPFTPMNYGVWNLAYATNSITSYGGYSSTASFYFLKSAGTGPMGQAHVSGTAFNAYGSNLVLMFDAVYIVN